LSYGKIEQLTMAYSQALHALLEMSRSLKNRQGLWNRLLYQFADAPRPDPAGIRLQVRPDATATRSVPLADQPEVKVMIRDRLYERSPYDDFDPRKYPVDFQGWGSDAPLLGESIQLVRPQRICEVGSWKGRSAINMANAAKALGLHTEIVCVDTWLGSPEHWLRQEPEWYSSLAIRHGMPQLYYTFLANVVRAGVSDVITPFPNTSEGAAAVFSALDIRFELAYVDAAHEYEPAKRDIALYYDLLAEEGLLIGDDYLHWPGVTQAADDFAQERRLPLIGARGKFVIPKGRRYADIKLAAGSA
jgi:predicted O-methyltransferase YrrM